MGGKIEFLRDEVILFIAVFQILPLRGDRRVENNDGFHVLCADPGQQRTGGFDQGFFVIVFQRFKVSPIQCDGYAADGALPELIKQRDVSSVFHKIFRQIKPPQEPGRKVIGDRTYTHLTVSIKRSRSSGSESVFSRLRVVFVRIRAIRA